MLMKKRMLRLVLSGWLAGRFARLAGSVLLCVLLALLACPVKAPAADEPGRPASLRILYAANACGIFQPCPT